MTSIHVTTTVKWSAIGSKTYACAFSNLRTTTEHDIREFIVSKLNNPTYELSVIELFMDDGTPHPGGVQPIEMGGYLYKAFSNLSSTTDDIITDIGYTTYCITLLDNDITAMNSTTSKMNSLNFNDVQYGPIDMYCADITNTASTGDSYKMHLGEIMIFSESDFKGQLVPFTLTYQYGAVATHAGTPTTALQDGTTGFVRWETRPTASYIKYATIVPVSSYGSIKIFPSRKAYSFDTRLVTTDSGKEYLIPSWYTPEWDAYWLAVGPHTDRYQAQGYNMPIDGANDAGMYMSTNLV